MSRIDSFTATRRRAVALLKGAKVHKLGSPKRASPPAPSLVDLPEPALQGLRRQAAAKRSVLVDKTRRQWARQ